MKPETPDSGPDRTPIVAGFDVADLDASGALVRRESIAAPQALRERKGSLEAAGVAREEGATLLYWVESVTTTDPDGRLRSAFTLKTAYGDRVATPPGGACEKCTMRVAIVAFENESIAFIRTDVDVIIPAPDVPLPVPAFVGLHLHRDGTVTSEALPWMSLPPPALGIAAPDVPRGSLSAVRDVEGRIVIVSGGDAWLADRSLRPLAGPVALPANDARVMWGSASDAAMTWTISPNEDGRSTSSFARREVFVGNGAIRERLSHGRAVLGAERRGDDVGLTFESAGRLFFAASSATGRKRGGDVFIRILSDNGSQFGEFSPDDATTVGATSAGHFTVVTLGRGVLETAEIVCAP